MVDWQLCFLLFFVGLCVWWLFSPSRIKAREDERFRQEVYHRALNDKEFRDRIAEQGIYFGEDEE